MSRIIFMFIAILGLGSTKCLKAQVFKNFVDSHLRLEAEAQPWGLSLETYPHFWLSGGSAGILSAEASRFQFGVMLWQVPVGASIRDAIFEGAGDIKIRNNSSAEIFANVYLRKDRKGFYLGMIGGPEWFDLEDPRSGQSKTLVKNYLVFPRVGFRWFLFKNTLYVDVGYGLSHNLGGREELSVGDSDFQSRPRLGIPFFSVGGRWTLGKKN